MRSSRYAWLLLLLLLAGCGDKPEDEYTDFIFQLPFQMTPRDTVAVGDTLWLTANFSDKLREFYSGNVYPVTPQNFKLPIGLALLELKDSNKSISTQLGAVSEFRFINDTGSLVPVSQTFNMVNLVYNQNNYKLRVGLIPRRAGVFCTTFLTNRSTSNNDNTMPDLSYLLSGTASNGGRRIASFRALYFYINEGKTNFYLFKEHCSTLSLDPNPGISSANMNIEQEASFTFVVK